MAQEESRAQTYRLNLGCPPSDRAHTSSSCTGLNQHQETRETPGQIICKSLAPNVSPEPDRIGKTPNVP